MKTEFDAEFLATDAGTRANDILRSCVHCGFCNATCPTYQITGDELDGPRGRIYLMRELLTTGNNEERATFHLDRCLTCRACETTCPSGVAYGELAEIARGTIGSKRSGSQGWYRRFLQWLVPNAPRLRSLARIGRFFRWMLSKRLAHQVPGRVGEQPIYQQDISPMSNSSVLVLNGCAQQVSTAQTNQHLTQILSERNVEVINVATETCCGALDLHLGDDSAALSLMKRNVEALYPWLDQVDAVISTASGCGVTVKDYGRLLASEADFAERAQAVATATVDVAEYLTTLADNEGESGQVSATAPLTRVGVAQKIAWHAPCSLQHGQNVAELVPKLLEHAGYTLVPVTDAHLCCGSAGTYSVLEPKLSTQLRDMKLAGLMHDDPELIATANVGCQTYLNQQSTVPVVHWIELFQ